MSGTDLSRSPYEQGELASSPERHMLDPDDEDEEDDDDKQSLVSFSVHSKEALDEDDYLKDNKDDYMDDSESLDIKPPQAHAMKKDKHKHKHKEERWRERNSRHEKERDRDRLHMRSAGKDRHAHELQRQQDKEKERERRLKDEVREARKREESRRERCTYQRLPTNLDRSCLESSSRSQIRQRSRLGDRLERLEFERRVREQREIREQQKERERQARKKEERRNQALRNEEMERAERRRLKRHFRSRSPSRESRHHDHLNRWDAKARPRKRSPDEQQAHSPIGPHTPDEVDDTNVEIPSDGSEEPYEIRPAEPVYVSEISEASHSDSESDSRSPSSASSSSSEDEIINNDCSVVESRNIKYHPISSEKTGLILESDPKSKFDDHSENESGTDSVQPSEHEETPFREGSPPASPIEDDSDLPPYLPAIQGCRSVEEFNCLNRIEEGTYGVVYRAKDKKSDEIVALKRLKMEKEKEGFPITSLREINTLLKAQHPNIVTVREIVVGSNMDKIYIVMDYVEHDLKGLMETMKQPFLVGEVKTLMLQLLKAVAHLHDNWILHRDLKTSNLLLSHKGILKVGDFGLAREYGSPLKHYTPVVVTLWYRAPELLLGTKEYTTCIDMWSVGCIMAEFLTMKPLWPGKSEVDQLTRIFKDLGTPNEKIWPGVSELPVFRKVNFGEYTYNKLRVRFGSYLTDLGFDLLNKFLTFDPSKRITAEEAKSHEYFKESPAPVSPSMFPTWPAKSEQPRKHGNSPKPPSGGKAYAKLIEEGCDEAAIPGGFHMATAAKGVSAVGPGFSLKF
ncbi:cyclin-dependent kinase 11B isoform X3 [Octopus sinensis]|nr:cyclin-dependent kinase 11B isoform X3 [Octopus sinensis]